MGIVPSSSLGTRILGLSSVSHQEGQVFGTISATSPRFWRCSAPSDRLGQVLGLHLLAEPGFLAYLAAAFLQSQLHGLIPPIGPGFWGCSLSSVNKTEFLVLCCQEAQDSGVIMRQSANKPNFLGVTRQQCQSPGAVSLRLFNNPGFLGKFRQQAQNIGGITFRPSATPITWAISPIQLRFRACSQQFVHLVDRSPAKHAVNAST